MEEYQKYLSGIWDRAWLTNHGPLVQELEQQLKEYLGVQHLLYVSNGTVAIQIAIKALELKGEVITTPFSYVATTTSLIWENCIPVFADIDERTFCINSSDIERHITPNTTAILATHVYGYACDVEEIERIAIKHNLKVIYDGAHAFDVRVKGQSIFSFGDVSTVSFHSTKLFHTIEGGAIITKDKQTAEKMSLYRSFGHIGDSYYSMGINGKNSEFHAAMGLCNLPYVEQIIQSRKQSAELYRKLLNNRLIYFPGPAVAQSLNYAYFPVVFQNEAVLLKIKAALSENEINTRRYFYPSLNTLSYLHSKNDCPVSENIATRVLCLPLYYEMDSSDIEKICKIVNSCFQ
jgi:dTDP-4-amino-4,6-dideoxygalactose transaminase